MSKRNSLLVNLILLFLIFSSSFMFLFLLDEISLLINKKKELGFIISFSNIGVLLFNIVVYLRTLIIISHDYYHNYLPSREIVITFFLNTSLVTIVNFLHRILYFGLRCFF